MNDLQSTRNIVFLVLTDTHLLDLAGPAQVFYEAGNLGEPPLDLSYVSLQPEAVSAQQIRFNGLSHPDSVELKEGDFLVIAGISFDSFKRGRLDREIDDLQDWLKRQYMKGVRLASICTGSLVLAQAGLLDEVHCTSHWKCLDYIEEHYPKVRTHSDRLFVKHRNIYTSAGMTSGIDMSLAIIEELYGPILTSKVARELVVFLRRDTDHSQESIYLDYQNHFNPAIHKVQDYIISNPGENPTLQELAGMANMSPRTLTRTFKEVTGSTITDFKHEVKVEHGKTLLNNPTYTIEEIARRCGYGNARQLRRIWKDKVGGSMAGYAKGDGGE